MCVCVPTVCVLYVISTMNYCTVQVIRYTVDYIIEYCTVSNEITLIKNIHITLLNLTRYVRIPKLQ